MPISASNFPSRRSRISADALERVDVRVQVADAQPVLLVVLGEVLGHALGQRGDQHALVALGPRAHLGHQVVDLRAGRAAP